MCDVALGSYYSRQGETHRGLLGWFVYFKVRWSKMERGRGQSAPPPVQATAGVYFFLMFWLFTGIYATVISIFYILYYMYIYVLRIFYFRSRGRGVRVGVKYVNNAPVPGAKHNVDTRDAH